MELEDIKTADLAGCPPTAPWTKRLCKAIGATTFHWLQFIKQDDRGWIITESLKRKGPALTRFTYNKVKVWRIKGLGEISPDRIIGITADYGAFPYDFEVNFLTAMWFLLRHYLGIVIPVVRNKRFNCQEWILCIGCELGVDIIPPGEYPYSANLEISQSLEYIGEVS